MNKNNKIMLAVIIAITVVMVGCIVIGVISKGKNEEPIKTVEETETTPSTEESSESAEQVTIPVIVSPEAESKADENEVTIDIGEMSRNPEPEVVSGDIEYETKN